MPNDLWISNPVSRTLPPGVSELRLICDNARKIIEVCELLGVDDTDLFPDSTFDADELGLVDDL